MYCIKAIRLCLITFSYEAVFFCGSGLGWFIAKKKSLLPLKLKKCMCFKICKYIYKSIYCQLQGLDGVMQQKQLVKQRVFFFFWARRCCCCCCRLSMSPPAGSAAVPQALFAPPSCLICASCFSAEVNVTTAACQTSQKLHRGWIRRRGHDSGPANPVKPV